MREREHEYQTSDERNEAHYKDKINTKNRKMTESLVQRTLVFKTPRNIVDKLNTETEDEFIKESNNSKHLNAVSKSIDRIRTKDKLLGGNKFSAPQITKSNSIREKRR